MRQNSSLISLFSHLNQSGRENMYELTYESVAKIGLTTVDIEEILKTSRTNNADNGVTGCLIYYNNKFIQILEGTQQAVRETYNKIKIDRRHSEVRLIAENATDEKTFPQWGMAYSPIDEKNSSPSESDQFRKNLALLADFSKPVSVSTILFWKKVKILVDELPAFDRRP